MKFLCLGILVWISLVQDSISSCDMMIVCPKEQKPVCASNGVTYANECEFLNAKCKVYDLQIVAEGICGQKESSNEGDICPNACGYIYEPVCDSNGHKYSNKCMFLRAKCADPTLTLRGQDGRCISINNIKCSVACLTGYIPVCGTDNITYSNECKLRLSACKDRSRVKVQYVGECHTVVSTESSEVKCPNACFEIYEPVCGSNYITYDNECTLKMAKCKTGSSTSSLTVLHTGPCKAFKGFTNPCDKPCSRELNPLCGSDGISYGNPCLFEIGQCQYPHLTLTHKGNCGEDGEFV